MWEPLVSVYVLTYQAEPYIADCLESILAQDYSNMEVLILDDASTDATVQMIDSYMAALRKKCVRVEMMHHKRNSGQICRNVNELLRLCKGDYIKGIAGDDALCADYLKEMVSYLEEHPDCAIAYCNGYYVPDTWHLGQKSPHNFFYHDHKQVAAEKTFEEILNCNYIKAPSVLFRRSVYEKYGYYDETMKYEDWEMWCRLALHKEHFGYRNKKLMYYRESVTGLSRGNTRQKIIDSYNFGVQMLNKYLPYVDREKARTIKERHIRVTMNAAKRIKCYDVAFLLWIRKRRL